jgi:acylphosphatase
MKTLKILIHGLVQGVGFRYFIERNAILLNLTGFVKNNPDGTVTVVIQGENSWQLLELARKGPQGSMVTNIEVREYIDGPIENFKIVRS